ncbi:TonB-dependent receptor [Phenylobacterium sp.]|uniref:TonB-dependent receptor n=1 Tax=Phenylobacterium sp. TaxID=1871053 RepID=UPI0035B20B26
MDRTLKSAGTAVALGLAIAPAAYAQPASDQPTIDELVVTAQKRSENLQDVPIVVTALPSRVLRDAGVTDIKGLQVLTPGLQVIATSGEQATVARIRGVGTVGDNPGLESSVGVVVDGVYRPRNGVAFGDLGDLERVEVLKGPQGTVFGKNATAGLINVITRAPAFSFGARAEAGFGNFSERTGRLLVEGPLKQDLVAGSLMVAAGKRDGFVDVVTGQGPRTKGDDVDRDYYAVRGQLLATPGTTRLRLIGDYAKRNESCCAGVQVLNGPTQPLLDAVNPVRPSVLAPADPFSRVAFLNRSTSQDTEDYGVSLQADVATNWGDLTYVGSGRKWVSRNANDIDFTTADILHRPDDGSTATRFTTYTHELRLAGRQSRLDYLVGAFYADEQLRYSSNWFYGADYEQYLGRVLSRSGAQPLGVANFVSVLTGLAPGASFAGGGGQSDRYDQKSKSYAVFTNNTLHISDALQLTLGVRYTDERKSLDSFQDTTDGGVGCATALRRSSQIAGIVGASNAGVVLANLCLPWSNPAFVDRQVRESRSDKEWTGSAKLAYRLSPETLVYASYARGFKAGGYNLDRAQGASVSSPLPITPAASTAFPAETVDTYEVGAKNTLLDRSLLLNLTGFYSKFEDFQLNSFVQASYVVKSIPQVTSYGADFDFLWHTPVDGLSAQGGLTWAVSQYGKDAVPGFTRLPGARISGAPRYSGALSGSYERSIGTYQGRASIEAKYLSEYNTGSDLNPLKIQKGFAVVNARVSLMRTDRRWGVELWADNLFDKDYYQVLYDAPLQPGSIDGFLGAPRAYGVTLRAEY